MPPSRNTASAVDPNAELNTTYSLALLAEYTHTLDSLPHDLSRHFADLRELDAVLSSSMAAITTKINNLTRMIEQGISSKEERLWLLTDIAEEAGRLKLGGEDKIRVAGQAADNLKYNANHLRSLAENLPGFDASALNRRTVYPHIAVKSYMPTISLETGRRRRGGYGSLLVSAPDASPVKRKRAQREDDLDITRSPKKDKAQETNSRSRARTKKNDRVASPSESVLSITSYNIPQSAQSNASASRAAATNANSRVNGSASGSTNRRARPAAQNNRGNTPNDRYLSPHDQNGNFYPQVNGHTSSNTTSRRDAYNNVPPSSLHPSLPHPYVNGNGTHIGNSGHHHPGAYDMHMMPQSIAAATDWNPPLPQQLEGPGMPVQRGHSAHPIIPVNSTVSAMSMATDGAEAGDGDGDGDDRTYCICNSISYGEMIACDDAQCEREWFHLTCINLAVPPEGRWFCDECRNKRNKRTNRGGKRRSGGGGRSNARS